jgi:signal transduction histidine kinase
VTSAGQRIEVHAALRPENGRRWVEIAVQDAGPSLAEERRARLFDPYPEPESVQDGTGLELAGLAGVVRDHGGSTAAVAGVNMGTTIVIRLPARPEIDPTPHV